MRWTWHERYSKEGSFRRQFDFLRRQFLQDGELPLADVLSRETVMQALDTLENAWNDRIYTPLATLWLFLGQVLSADHSCRQVVGMPTWSGSAGRTHRAPRRLDLDGRPLQPDRLGKGTCN